MVGTVDSGRTSDTAIAPPPHLGYQPALDGLRAIAAGSVLLYHGGVTWSSGGFLGVDVFFVLSGFLITSLLITEWQRTGGIAILSFYGRRLRRLLPAMLLMLAAVLVYAAVLAPESQLHQLRGDFLGSLGYVANWRLVFEHRGYFDAFATPSPLTHTWSLGVEEQWYLIWPIVVIGLLKLTKRANRSIGLAGAVVGVLCVASTMWMAWLYAPGTDPSRVYYGTDTRAQELLAGALLAFLCVWFGRYTVRAPARGFLNLAGVAGLGWMFVLFATVDDRTTWLYQGGMLLFSFVIALVIFAAVQPTGVVRTALSPRPLRWLGTISYGLYLWHWPIYVVVNADRMGFSGATLLAVRLALTVATATASYYLVERPIRAGNLSPRVFLVSAPAVVGAAIVGVLVVTTGAPASTSALEAAVTANGKTGDLFSYDPNANPPPSTLPGEQPIKVLMTGDSVALTLTLGIAQRSGVPPVLWWDKSSLGCSLFPGKLVVDGVPDDSRPQCAPWHADRHRWVGQFAPDVVAILSAVWEVYDREVDGTMLTFATPEWDTWFSKHLDTLIAEMSSGGAKVAIINAPCSARPASVAGDEPLENDGARIDHLNSLYRAAVNRNADHAALIDLHQFMCPGGVYLDQRKGVTLRGDDRVHFSPEGAAVTRAWLLPRLRRLAAQ
ncbi:MAG: acyltransferase family protein [Acidimicrobiia bacterium]